MWQALVLLPAVWGFYLDLAASDRLCFSEELSQQTLVVGEVMLVGDRVPAALKVTVTDSVGVTVFEKDQASYAKFSFTTLDAGVHQFCLANFASQPVELNFDISIGIDAKDYTNIASTKDLKPTELAIQRMKDRTAQIHKEVQYLREREEEMRNTNVTIHNRVIGYSICTLLFLLVLALVQIVYLRRVFRAKKVI